VAIIGDGLSFLLMAALMGWVRLPRQVESREAPLDFWGDLRGGIQLMSRSRMLILTPVVALLLNASLAPVTAILPKLFDRLGAQATGYATFLALESLGMLSAGMLLVAVGNRFAPQKIITAGLLLTAGAYAVMWSCPVAGVLWPSAAVLGFGFGLGNIPFQTLLQQLVPQHFLGRVFSVLGMVSSVGMPLSLLLVSPWLDRLPLALWFGVAALAQGVGGLIWLWAMRAEGRKQERAALI
jgi:DHA3 family macrolide efflux protein-like MFS transporter